MEEETSFVEKLADLIYGAEKNKGGCKKREKQTQWDLLQVWQLWPITGVMLKTAHSSSGAAAAATAAATG